MQRCMRLRNVFHRRGERHGHCSEGRGGSASARWFSANVRCSSPRPAWPKPSLPWGRCTSRIHLPRLLAILTHIAARIDLAGMLTGTGTFGAAVEDVETVI